MQKVRRQARTDRNQAQIVRELRELGANVLVLSSIGDGCPDLLVGMKGKLALCEVKDPMQPPSKRRLTDDERVFHVLWQGYSHVVESTQDVLKILE